MGPTAAEDLPEGASWPDLLTVKNKRFIHREIFTSPAESRDFILSLDADLAYEVTQMWSCFDLAAQMGLESNDRPELAGSFRDFLGHVCLKAGVSPTISAEDRKTLQQIEPRWTTELQKRGIQLLPFKPPG